MLKINPIIKIVSFRVYRAFNKELNKLEIKEQYTIFTCNMDIHSPVGEGNYDVLLRDCIIMYIKLTP